MGAARAELQETARVTALGKDWPKEVSLGEHTSLGPNSYCPDYRSLLVTT